MLHLRCVGIFCFNQLTNYNAIAEDALVATRMNKGPGKKQPKMQNSWYIDKYGKKQNQTILFSDTHSVPELREKPKGIQQVLEKCNIWPASRVNLVCKRCSKKSDNEFEELDCCVLRIMSLQPDFCE